MLLPLMAVLTGLAATPLTTQEVAEDARSIVAALDVAPIRITIRELHGANHSSPLLVSHENARCTILVNQGTLAHATWDAYLGDAEGATAEALRDFAVAHELGHCIVSQLRERSAKLPVLLKSRHNLIPVAKRVSASSVSDAPVKPRKLKAIDVKTYDELLCDLVGLRYVQLKHPDQYALVRKRLLDVRKSFAFDDPQHDSSFYLNDVNVASVARLLGQFNRS